MVQLTKRRSFALPSELKQFGILGINARNIDFLLGSNKRSLYPYVDNKILTKKTISVKFGWILAVILIF